MVSLSEGYCRVKSRGTRAFVSYTTRDGCVSLLLLERLRERLAEICDPYIHALDEPKGEIGGQLRVFKKLLTSHLLIIVETPGVYKSPWVKIEVLLSKMTMTPIIRLESVFVDGII